MFPQLNLPQYAFKIEKRQKDYFIWDVLRKKWLLITPEEWVRQHLLWYFLEELDYPKSYIKSEVSVHLGENTQRADIVIYNEKVQPAIVIECKAPEIKLNQNVVDQACRYNYELQAEYLIVSNGMEHLVYKIAADKRVELLDKIPEWKTI